MAPNYNMTTSMQRVVTFKFPNVEGDSYDSRVCLMGLLTRYEYFQKAFEQWQEGASAEVNVNDSDPACAASTALLL